MNVSNSFCVQDVIYVNARRVTRAVFLRAAGAARARCIIVWLLEPVLAAALNQPKRARQTGFLRVARSTAVGDALRIAYGDSCVDPAGNQKLLHPVN